VDGQCGLDTATTPTGILTYSYRMCCNDLIVDWTLQESSLEAWKDDHQALLLKSAAQQTRSRGASAAAEKRWSIIAL